MTVVRNFKLCLRSKLLIKLYCFLPEFNYNQADYPKNLRKTKRDFMFLLKLHQYIDVPRVNDPLEDAGWDLRVQRVMGYVMYYSIPCVFVSNGCGGIDLLRKMMYSRIVMRYRAKVLG